MALKLRQKFPLTLALVHGWLFPIISQIWPKIYNVIIRQPSEFWIGNRDGPGSDCSVPFSSCDNIIPGPSERLRGHHVTGPPQLQKKIQKYLDVVNAPPSLQAHWGRATC